MSRFITGPRKFSGVAESPVDGLEDYEEDEKAEKVQSMFDRIAPRYDFVNRIMTFRLDVRWRKQTVQALRLSNVQSLIIL